MESQKEEPQTIADDGRMHAPASASAASSAVSALQHWEAELGRPSDLALFDDNDPPKILPIGSTEMAG